MFWASLAIAPIFASAGLSPEQPIGVFDSGTGGLTVLETLLAADAFDNVTGEQSPDGKPDFSSERFVYFGDQANMPYGVYDAEGKADFLRELVVRDARFVLGGDRHAPAKIVVIACNTATAYGLDAATEVARPGGVKVIGVVNAGVAATLDALKAKSGMAPFAVGVMATPGTIASGVYERTLRAAFAEKRIDSFEIVNRGGVGLAEAVENDEPGMRDCARTNFTALVESYRARGGKAPIRAVILGCTHYPFVLSTFKAALADLRADDRYRSLLADDLLFVDPAVYTAVQCFRALKADGLLNRGQVANPRVKPFISVGRNGPLSHAEKYGRSVGQADIGTVIVPMTRKTMSEEAIKRLNALLPVSARELFPAPAK
jgi:glutamate racemase